MQEQQHLDVLQNIEFAIVAEYRRDTSILDQDARDAVAALVRHFEAEQESRSIGAHRLTARATKVFEAVHRVCEWRLGRAPGPDGSSLDGDKRELDVIVACLRRIRKSVDFWTKEGGRQGYLKYVMDFLP